MINLASHNSFTYYKPKGIISKLFSFMARCQRVNVYEQYMIYGVRVFDLRIYPTGTNTFDIRHGYFKVNTSSLMEDLKFLNNQGDVQIRILLEQPIKKSDKIEQLKIEQLFRFNVDRLAHIFDKIKFFGGQRKYDWKVSYQFVYQGPSITDKYSSTTNLINSKAGNNHWTAILDDWWPWLYAKLRNKKNLEMEYDTEYLMIDYVDIPKRY